MTPSEITKFCAGIDWKALRNGTMGDMDKLMAMSPGEPVSNDAGQLDLAPNPVFDLSRVQIAALLADRQAALFVGYTNAALDYLEETT